jgi:hypothetical protein
MNIADCVQRSKSGIVNVYGSPNPATNPKHLKAFGNLTTKISSVHFNHTSELMVMSSPVKKDQLRLVRDLRLLWIRMLTVSIRYTCHRCLSIRIGQPQALLWAKSPLPAFRMVASISPLETLAEGSFSMECATSGTFDGNPSRVCTGNHPFNTTASGFRLRPYFTPLYPDYLNSALYLHLGNFNAI